MLDQETPAASDEPRIDSTFRNGSVTAVGIILGFSLSFLSQWASNPIAWSAVDILAATPIITGIGLQGKAFADLLSIRSLVLVNYDRARVAPSSSGSALSPAASPSPSSWISWGSGRVRLPPNKSRLP